MLCIVYYIFLKKGRKQSIFRHISFLGKRRRFMLFKGNEADCQTCLGSYYAYTNPKRVFFTLNVIFHCSSFIGFDFEPKKEAFIAQLFHIITIVVTTAKKPNFSHWITLVNDQKTPCHQFTLERKTFFPVSVRFDHLFAFFFKWRKVFSPAAIAAELRALLLEKNYLQRQHNLYLKRPGWWGQRRWVCRPILNVFTIVFT